MKQWHLVDSRANNAVRSVPLIQRSDLARLSGLDAARRDDETYRSGLRQATAAPLREAPEERATRRRSRREEEREPQRRRRSGRRDERRASAWRDADDQVPFTDSMDTAPAFEVTPFGLPRRDRGVQRDDVPRRSWPPDEDTPTRPARWRQDEEAASWQTSRPHRGFTLVPDDEPAQDEPTRLRPEPVSAPPAAERDWTPRSAFFTEEDYYEAGGPTGRAHRGTMLASEPEAERTWTARSAIYTQDDYYHTGGISGFARRREAVVAGLASIPRAIVGGLEGLLGHVRGLSVVLVVAMVLGMLYAPARNLYAANRQLDELQATYDMLMEENDSLRSELEMLQTREGIENEARSRGYVPVGETKVVVENLPEELVTHEDEIATVMDAELPDTRPWYTVVLDRLFGYEPGA